jgi:hypothetical protein
MAIGAGVCLLGYAEPNLMGYDDGGRAELYFADPFDVQTEKSSHTHKIWVAPEFIERCRT